MMIGHLPAGYLVARTASALGAPALFWGLIAGCIAPDIDMLWFIFVDGGQVHHHDYVTHRPAIWLLVVAIGALVRMPLITGIGFGALLHMMLDSIAGKIAWGWPFSHVAEPLVVVPASQSHWVLSFLLHWTFAVELAICAVALFMVVRGKRTS